MFALFVEQINEGGHEKKCNSLFRLNCAAPPTICRRQQVHDGGRETERGSHEARRIDTRSARGVTARAGPVDAAGWRTLLDVLLCRQRWQLGIGRLRVERTYQ